MVLGIEFELPEAVAAPFLQLCGSSILQLVRGQDL